MHHLYYFPFSLTFSISDHLPFPKMSNKHTAAKNNMVNKMTDYGNTDNILKIKGILKMEHTVHLHLCKIHLYYIQLNKNPTGTYCKIPTIHLRYRLIFFLFFTFLELSNSGTINITFINRKNIT